MFYNRVSPSTPTFKATILEAYIRHDAFIVQERKRPQGNHAQIEEHLPELRDKAREHAHESSKHDTERHEEIRNKVKVLVLTHKDKHRLVEIQVGIPAAGTAALALEMQNIRRRRVVVLAAGNLRPDKY